MKVEMTATFVRRILELSPEKLSFPGVQYLISNPFRLSVLLAWFFARTSVVKGSKSPAGKDSKLAKAATDDQFKSLAAKILVAGDRWWSEAGLKKLLASRDFDSDFVRFVNAAPELAGYLSDFEFQNEKSTGPLPREANKFDHNLFTLVQRLYTRVDLGSCSVDERLAKLCALDPQSEEWGEPNRWTLDGVFKVHIKDTEISGQLLSACGKSVADQAQYIPSHFWFGRRLYFLGTAISSSEGPMVLCMDNTDKKSKTPTPKWIMTSSSLSSEDRFLCWKEMPEIELLK
jgi:hypothetical protein